MLEVLLVATAAATGVLGGWWLRGVEGNQQPVSAGLDASPFSCEIMSRLDHLASQLVTEARTDALTELANRRAFDEEVQRHAGEFRRSGRPVSVLLIDVDHFKRLNDTFGHQAGDKVLQGVAEVLRKTVPQREMACRYGGEEFAVVLPGSALAAAQRAAERVRAAIAAARFPVEQRILHATASVGLAELQEDEELEGWLKRADQALYASKQAGRNCGHWHDGQGCHPLSASPDPLASARRKIVAVDSAHLTGGSGSPSQAAHEALESLLPLSDRQSFHHDVNRRLAEWRRGGLPLAILLIRVDHLGQIVQQHGEAAGEAVLQATARFLQMTLRDTDHLARHDQETFSLLLPTARLINAVTIGKRLQQALPGCSLPDDTRRLRFTVRFGAAETQEGDDAAAMLIRAQAALEAGTQKRSRATSLSGSACAS